MTPAPAAPALVVLVGPQAAGKSTVARALSAELRRHGEVVALVELDQIAAMAGPSLPDWESAHHILGVVGEQWARAGASCVVAEGVGSRQEVEDLIAHVPTAGAVVTVVVTTPFEVALARAQADPSRGVSRQHDFLSRRYRRWAEEREQIVADVVVDTQLTSLRRSVELVGAALAAARAEQPPR